MSVPKEALEQEFIELLQSITPNRKYEKLFKAIVVDVWKKNYKHLGSEGARIEKEINILKEERLRVFDLHRAGKYEDDEFLEQKNLINLKIAEKEALRAQNKIEEFSMEEALDYCFRFVRDTAKTWLTLKDQPAHRLRFQNQVFPEKVLFDGKKFGTKKMSLVYELNQTNDAENTKLVTLRGIEPRFHP